MKRTVREEDEEDFGSQSDSEPEETGVKRVATNGKRQREAGTAPTAWRRGNSNDEDSEDANSSGDDSEDDEDHQDQEGDIPLGQLIALKQDGSTAGPAMRARVKAVKAAAAAAGGGGASFKRDNKHRPTEMSSKRPVPVLREALQGGKNRGKDPRFDPLIAGGGSVGNTALDSTIARKRYSFLFDEKLPEQRRDLQDALKKTKSQSKKAGIKEKLAQLSHDSKAEAARRKKESAEDAQRRQRQESLAAGKSPFYLKKSEQKRQELLAKYEELKDGGGLEKFMEKRRKKNASKDHRYLPSRRPE